MVYPAKTNSSSAAVDEGTPLLADDAIAENLGAYVEPNGTFEDPLSTFAVVSILSVLLVGVFVVNVDMTFMLTAYPQISSSFDSLEYGSWLITAYMLAMCATQSLYGKLSNIYGRKSVLIITYLLYATGCGICATSSTISQVLFGRIVGGTGAAGMVCLVSIVITDIVPLREVAIYRSYVNVIQTVGRSVGAPIGGFVMEKLGWRAAFAINGPVTLLGAMLVVWKLRLKSHPSTPNKDDQDNVVSSNLSKLKRIDFLGSFILAVTIVSFLLIFTLGGNQVAWNHPLIWGMCVATIILAVLFYMVEVYWASEPIFPPFLLTYRSVSSSYGLLFVQNAAQAAATMSIPLFYQVFLSASPAVAGAYLLPSVVGNTLGGILSGVYVKKGGSYQILCVLSGIISAISYTLILMRWRISTNFNPNIEDLYIFPAGIGTGMAHAASFIALTAGITAATREGDGKDNVHDNLAIAGAGMYVSGNLGAAIGVSISSVVLQTLLQRHLETTLKGRELEHVLTEVKKSVEFVQKLPKGTLLRDIVVEAYVGGVHGTFIMAIVCSLLAILFALMIPRHRLE